MADDLDSTIREAATGPKRATIDGQSVEGHSLPDQIAADKHLASKRATQSTGLGIKLAKISPGGTV